MRLNPAQQRAAEHGSGPLLIVAGAGTGKTGTIVARVSHLLRQGVTPERILLLTFTRRAAQEMLARVAASVGKPAWSVQGGTFHATAVNLLRRHARVLGWSNRFTVLDRSDSADLVGVARTAVVGTKPGKRFPQKQTILNLLSKAINTGQPLQQIVNEDAPRFVDQLDVLHAIGERYGATKRANQVMDYDDLLVELRRLLREHPSVRATIAGAYEHVLVDEYQDTNRLQAEIACLLATGHGNLVVVGDEAQSIYRFRGADFRNIMDFPRIFPQATVVTLEQNYRSVQPILDLANAVLGQAEEGYRKELRGERSGDDKPALVVTDDEHEQARWLIEEILHLREEGLALDDMAVLVRSAFQSNILEVALEQAQIPFKKFGGMAFVEAAHVKDVGALLRLSENPTDIGAWFRVLAWLPGIGDRTAGTIAEAVQEAEGDLAVLLEHPAATRVKRAKGDLRELHDLLQAARAIDDLQARLGRVLAWYRPRMEALYDDTVWRERDLDTLIHLAERYRSVERFLTDLAIEPPDAGRLADGDDKDDEHLTVSTVHSAKGLEWRVVFVLHCNDGGFPNRRALAEDGGREEERRLFYVAVTRAKDRLYLLRPEYVVGYDGRGSQPLSSFLGDLDDLYQLVETTNVQPPTADDPPADAASGRDAYLDNILDYFR